MRVVFVGADVEIGEMVQASISHSWPDVAVLVASTAREGMALVRQAPPNLVVVYPDFTDLSLSKTLQELRRLSSAPLLVLGRQGHEEEEAVAALANEADYIWPPADATLIMVRVWSLLRRSGPTNPGLAPPDREQLESAILAMNEALRLNPADPLSYASRALAYTLLGYDVAAQRDVDRAAALGVDRAALESSIEELKRQR